MTCGIVGAGGAGLSAAEVRYRIIDLGVLAEQEPTGTGIDCSGDVDGADLGLLLAQFGCGVPSTGGAGQSAMMAGSEAASLSLDGALALAGFASVEALVQWCATAGPSEVEALGIWLAGVMGGGAQ